MDFHKLFPLKCLYASDFTEHTLCRNCGLKMSLRFLPFQHGFRELTWLGNAKKHSPIFDCLPVSYSVLLGNKHSVLLAFCR